MSTPITPVQNTQTIRDSEFVNLTVTFTDGTTRIQRSIRFSSSFQSETISGNTYPYIGGLLAITPHQRDLSASSYDTGITIQGIDPFYIYIVAGGPATVAVPVTGQADIPVGYYPIIKGSQVQIYRGFYDTNYTLTNSYLRYTGIVTNYSILEERESSYEPLNNTYTISLQCSSIRQVLENRISGRKTSQASWQSWFSTDTSMNRVGSLSDRQFDFGKPVVSGGSSVSGTSELDPRVTEDEVRQAS